MREIKNCRFTRIRTSTSIFVPPSPSSNASSLFISEKDTFTSSEDNRCRAASLMCPSFSSSILRKLLRILFEVGLAFGSWIQHVSIRLRLGIGCKISFYRAGEWAQGRKTETDDTSSGQWCATAGEIFGLHPPATFSLMSSCEGESKPP